VPPKTPDAATVPTLVIFIETNSTISPEFAPTAKTTDVPDVAV